MPTRARPGAQPDRALGQAPPRPPPPPGIAQHNGGDHDADNNGSPSDKRRQRLVVRRWQPRSPQSTLSRAARPHIGHPPRRSGTIRLAATRRRPRRLEGRPAPHHQRRSWHTRRDGGRYGPTQTAASSTKRPSQAPRHSPTGPAFARPTTTKRATATSFATPQRLGCDSAQAPALASSTYTTKVLALRHDRLHRTRGAGHHGRPRRRPASRLDARLAPQPQHSIASFSSRRNGARGDACSSDDKLASWRATGTRPPRTRRTSPRHRGAYARMSRSNPQRA